MKNKNDTGDKPIYSQTNRPFRKTNLNVQNIRFTLFIICIAIIIMIVIALYSDNWIPAISSSLRTLGNLFALLSIVIIIPIGFGVLVISIFGKRFPSIKEEVQYSKEKDSKNFHSVLCILGKTDSDCFVLADFKQKNEIRPAIYTRRRKKVTLIDLRTDVTYFKSINLNNTEKYDEQHEVRIRRIKNRITKTQMIYFASDIKNLDIYFNQCLVPKINCEDKIGKFAIYGIVEDSENCNCNVVNINGCDYPLIETPVEFYFINKDEI